ncbi:MAG: cyclic peptide export ABC transporter, partial [Myxococcota bacterium]
WDHLTGNFEGLILGNRELKLNRPRRQAFMTEELTRSLTTMRDASIRGGVVYAFANSWGQNLTVLLIGMVLFVVPAFYTVQSHVLSGYTLAVIQLTGSLGALLDIIPQWSRAQISLDKVTQLELDLVPEQVPVLQVSSVDNQSERPWSRIELRGVTYTLNREGDDSFTLGPIDLEFRPGTITFITGGNGSGKTTMAKLVSGLYPPMSGEILVDDQVIGDGDWDDYRQLFAVSFADEYLFQSLLGLDEQRVRTHVQQFELEPWVHVESGAFSTIALSQGQRKRLALSVILAQERPFYIFDEWTANQDPPFRDRFYRTILPELKAKGHTVLVITHDDRYDHLADMLIRLDRGTLRDSAAPASDEAESERPVESC